MESKQHAPLVVIVGPTASGKSALALEIARRYDGEIICADSRTVYKGMDIGTAKPSAAEQAEIPHHILDVVTPEQTFTAAEFKRRALLWIDDIAIRGKLPIMVGGTGLYVDGVIFDYAFLPPVPPEEREELEAMTVEQLQAEIISRGIAMPENKQNKRHLVRALETNGEIPVRKGLRANTLVLGINIAKAELEERVHLRIHNMLESGLEDEVRGLAATYDWQVPGMTAVGYREWQDYFRGMQDLHETEQMIARSTMQYAKRQRTWFKRNPHIEWIQNAAEADRLVKEFLQKLAK